MICSEHDLTYNINIYKKFRNQSEIKKLRLSKEIKNNNELIDNKSFSGSNFINKNRILDWLLYECSKKKIKKGKRIDYILEIKCLDIDMISI